MLVGQSSHAAEAHVAHCCADAALFRPGASLRDGIVERARGYLTSTCQRNHLQLLLHASGLHLSCQKRSDQSVVEPAHHELAVPAAGSVSVFRVMV